MKESAFCDSSLHGTVKVICGLLTAQVDEGKRLVTSETDFRYELVACLLGSQVRAESANIALWRLANAGLLSDDRWGLLDDAFEADVVAVLANRDGAGKKESYRFPQLRAKQLSQMRVLLQCEPLTARLVLDREATHLRADLVRDLPGIGPKQASMFLRNVGISYDVAILDVHVLRFFQLLGLLPEQKIGVSSLKHYEGAERVAKQYAIECGHRVGYLDWAIWITMRAAKELRA